MKIPEAIEIVSSIKHDSRGLLPPKDQKALSLSIEALKFIDYCRSGTYNPPFELLPGETPQENPLPRLAEALNKTK